jgi:hypothetical protein
VALERKTLLAALALSMLAFLATAQVASGTHPRPKGATPLRVSLAVAYQQCPTGTGNKQHGPPLAVLSCNPQHQASSFLTVGTSDAWPGTSPKMNGFVRFEVKPTSPEDVKITSTLSDVRCIGNSVPGFCDTANTDVPTLPDYTGELNGTLGVRITDHASGAIGAGGGTEAATANDITLAVPAQCVATADTTWGAACTVNTTANTFFPGAVQDAKRTIIEAQTISIDDGGGDGFAGTTFDNTPFLTQGIFVP